MKYQTVIALALGAAARPTDPWELMHRARDLLSPDALSQRSEQDTHPCKILADAYTTADPEPGKLVTVEVPPSVGTACLKSVPLDKKRNKALLKHLFPFVSFHSTIEILADPPEEYLVPGVDILGGWENITAKLDKDLYENQYDFMVDLRSLFVAAADNHFDYSPALLNTIVLARRGLDFVSVSLNGLELPELFMRSDVIRGNHGELDYWPSAVKSIDDVPAVEFLEKLGVLAIANCQDPDAQYNNMFSSIPVTAAGRASNAAGGTFEIPDNYTIQFYNGSEKVFQNNIRFPPGVNFTGIDSGEIFHKVFEVPAPPRTESAEPTSSTATKTAKASSATATASATSTALPGYPKPMAKLAQDSIAGYYLNETDYKDVVVVSILSFSPLKFKERDTIEFMTDAQQMLAKIIKKAKKDGKDKLVIDLSANGGGSKPLAGLLYNTLFPGAKIDLLDRYRAIEALEAASAADYSTLDDALINGYDGPIDVKGKIIPSGSDWFGPYTVAGQNVTKGWLFNTSLPLSTDPDLYYNGHDPSGKTDFSEPPFKPEDILIVTDGTCASSCTIFTGFMTRNQGVRTLALGGRPQKLAMQAMGGTKGTKLGENSHHVQRFQLYEENMNDDPKSLKILEDARDSIPSAEDPPLLPLFVGQAGGAVNSLSGYTSDRPDDYPVHFRYEAANCRLFYTQRMTFDVTEVWRRAAGVAWGNGTCVEGSTTSLDGRIGDKTVKFNPKVKSRVPGIKGPGSLE